MNVTEKTVFSFCCNLYLSLIFIIRNFFHPVYSPHYEELVIIVLTEFLHLQLNSTKLELKQACKMWMCSFCFTKTENRIPEEDHQSEGNKVKHSNITRPILNTKWTRQQQGKSSWLISTEFTRFHATLRPVVQSTVTPLHWRQNKTASTTCGPVAQVAGDKVNSWQCLDRQACGTGMQTPGPLFTRATRQHPNRSCIPFPPA